MEGLMTLSEADLMSTEGGSIAFVGLLVAVAALAYGKGYTDGHDGTVRKYQQDYENSKTTANPSYIYNEPTRC